MFVRRWQGVEYRERITDSHRSNATCTTEPPRGAVLRNIDDATNHHGGTSARSLRFWGIISDSSDK